MDSHLLMFDSIPIVSLYTNIENTPKDSHLINCIYDSKTSNMISYRFEVLQMTHRLMLTNILP